MLYTRITRIYPCRHNCHGWPSAGEKSSKLINTPSHSSNDGQASPCLNSIPLKFLSSSLVPSYALYFLITVLYMHHNPSILISPSVPASLGTCFPWAFRYNLDEINQNTFTTPNSHSQSHTTLSASEILKPHHSHCIQIPSQFILFYIHSFVAHPWCCG